MSTQGIAELRRAIASTAFVRSSDGIRIIGNESEGRRVAWAFDFRNILLQPEWLNRYAEIFWERYADRYPFQVCGMETAGIALVAAIVMKGVERGTPVNGFYIRKSRKRYNLMKQVEGTLTDDVVIFVDDLVNTGQTLNRTLLVVEECGLCLSDIFVLLRFRDESAYAFFADKRVALCALFSVEDFGLPLQTSKAPEVPRDAFETLWRFTAPDPSFHLIVQKSAPALDDDTVFFGADSGVFYAVDALTGNPRWSFKVGKHPRDKGILSTPIVHAGTVYFGAYDGNVYALDAKTGKERWVYDDADWVGSSPAIAGDQELLFIGLEYGLFTKRGGVAAIELATGRERWQARHAGTTHGSPLHIREEGLVILGSNDASVYAYDASTGTLVWQHQTGGDIKTTPAYDAKRHLVFVASMDKKLYAISASKGEPLWAYATEGGIYSIPLVHQDLVYVASLDKTIYAIDIGSGAVQWTFETSGRIFGSPVIADGSLWIGSNDGRLYELSPETGALQSFFQATERVMSRIAYDDRTKSLFVRTAANEVYCIKKRNGITASGT
jgi:outer membrane protein assembly factor BamB/adenine/guanine phosphoribosyltransferase-like PRPP-binding protein